MRTAALMLCFTMQLAAEPVLLPVAGTLPPVPPPEQVAELLPLVCPVSAIRTGGVDFPGFPMCRICPLGANLPLLGYAITAIHYGHFTLPSLEQALVSITGCEPHSMNWGGSLLFTKHEGHWRYSRYLTGAITENCTGLERADGRTILVCTRTEGHQGVRDLHLYTFDPALAESTGWETPILNLSDNTNTCGFNLARASNDQMQPLQRAVFQRIEVDAAAATVTAIVDYGVRRITAAQAKACMKNRVGGKLPADAVPATKSYAMQFQWNGQTLRVTPETAAYRALVQSRNFLP